ncbi:hypothetical protein [Cupriavidus basilensis]|uniref:hypothetical protein n=1 Tax=Cupriavidus basilensis TaxID=68895 RepID=UPI000750D8D3|nr:hypothetical protein [Cupriavidus basilensis]
MHWLNFLTSDIFHRVILWPLSIQTDVHEHATSSEVWSLFIVPAKDMKVRGFLRDKGRPLGQVFTPSDYGIAGK